MADETDEMQNISQNSETVDSLIQNLLPDNGIVEDSNISFQLESLVQNVLPENGIVEDSDISFLETDQDFFNMLAESQCDLENLPSCSQLLDINKQQIIKLEQEYTGTFPENTQRCNNVVST